MTFPGPERAGGCVARLVTPDPALTGGAGIACIEVTSDSAEALDELLERAGCSGVPLGGRGLRRVCGVDHGVVARWSGTSAGLMPHGGAAVIAGVLEGLARAGCALARADEAVRTERDVRGLFPEASDLVEACVLDAMWRASSPLAADVLLRQRERWRRGGAVPLVDAETGVRLARLLEPPTVVLLGRPNIGKSTLTNAMAGRAVSIVADLAGTTRDHVGVMIEAGGVVVRWIDAPGIVAAGGDELERQAMELALRAAEAADLVVWCGDGREGFLDPALIGRPGLARAPGLRVWLRGDLAAPAETVDVVTAAERGEGLEALSLALRERLVGDAALGTEGRWVFHAGLVGAGEGAGEGRGPEAPG